MSIYIFLLVLCLGFASAIDFYITSPYSATRWTAGSVAKITWNILEGGAKVDSVNVDLMDGDDNNASVIASLASGVDPGQNYIYWAIPDNFVPTSSVFIRVSGVGSGATVYRFSHRFAVGGSSAAQKESVVESKVSKTQPAKSESARAQSVQSSVETSGASSKTSGSTTTTDPLSDESIPRASVTVLYRQISRAESVHLERGAIAKMILLLLSIAIIY